jgi:RecA-family ATPase
VGRASLFIGSGGEGKGTWLLQLLAGASSGAADVFGLPIHPDFHGGNVVLLAGEDDQGELEDRMDRMRSGGVDASGVVCIRRERGKTLTAALAEARQVPNLAAVVVDPAGRWMHGEFGGDAEEVAVNALYALVDGFARDTGAAVIVVHHLPKASAVQRGGPVVARETPRGTEAWRDAFRQVVTFRKNPKDEPPGARLHLEKSNIASAPPGAILRFNYDPATLLHRVVAEAPGSAIKAPLSKPTAGDAGDVEDVVAAVARLVGGETPSKVSRTGKAGLFERNQRPRDRVPEVDGWPRARVEAAVSAALDARVLTADPKLGLRPS